MKIASPSLATMPVRLLWRGAAAFRKLGRLTSRQPWLAASACLLLAWLGARPCALAVPPIEGLQRSVQQRWQAVVGGVATFPKSPAGVDPGPNPKDGFYGAALEDESFLRGLVSDLEGKASGLAGRFHLDPKLEGTTTGIDYNFWGGTYTFDPWALTSVGSLPCFQPLPSDRSVDDRVERLEQMLKAMQSAALRTTQYYVPGGPTYGGFLYDKHVENMVPDSRDCDAAFDGAFQKYMQGTWTDLAAAGAFMPDYDNNGQLFFRSVRNGLAGGVWDPVYATSNIWSRGGSCICYVNSAPGNLEFYLLAYGGAEPTCPVAGDGLWHQYDTQDSSSGMVTCKPIGMDDDPPVNPGGCTSSGWTVVWSGAIFRGQFQDDWTPRDCPCRCSSSKVESIHYSLGLGSTDFGERSTQILFDSATARKGLCVPSSLTFKLGLHDELIKNASKVPIQVVTPTTVAAIVVINADKFEVREYPWSAAGPKQPNGAHTLTGTPTRVVSYEYPDPSNFNVVLITEKSGSRVVGTHRFAYNPLNDGWQLTKGGGLSTEVLSRSWDGAHVERTERRQLVDGRGALVRDSLAVYHVFPFGERMVRQVLDPNGAALTTTWSYWTDSGQPGRYGQLRQTVQPGGHWETFDYNGYGEQNRHVVQFLDQPLGSADGQNRVVITTRSSSNPVRAEVETLKGVETRRAYTVRASPSETREVVCTHAGAAWDDPTNLVTVTRTRSGGDFAGKIASVQQPDGTLTTYDYSYSGNHTQQITVACVGAASANGTTVVDGTRTTTVLDVGGNQLLQLSEDIASGLQLSSALTTQADPFGRPTVVTYADGHTETTSYGCCGVDSRTDRDGITTAYTYDALGRVATQARAGLTLLYTYDADGNQLKTVRQGSDGSQVTLSADAFDRAGRQIAAMDGLTRTTLFTQKYDAATGHMVWTTKLADDSTRVETYLQDGNLLSVGGTAAHPVQYAYGTDADAGVWTQEIRFGSQGETTEWTRTYADVAGRKYKTETAAGAVTQSFFNALGQTIRTVDPDGVTTLYGYNARGEQDTVALDLDQNGQIALAGTDRITRVSRAVVHAHDATVVRTTTSAWTADGVDAAAVVAVDEQSADGRASWHTDAGGLLTHTQTSCDGTGGCTTTVTAPDGSFVVGVTQGGRATSQTRYDANSQVLSGTTMDYDPQGRLWHQTDLRDGLTTYTYDDADQLRRISHGGQAVGYDYDALGRKTLQTEPDGGQVQTLYWPTGRVKSLGGARTYPQEYTYDSQGRLKTLTTHGASGAATTTWNYDAQSGQMIAKAYADGKGPSYTYTPGGRLFTRNWARGIVTTYGYDHAGRLQSVSYSDGTTPSGGYGYDRLGRLVAASGGGSARALAYQGNTSLLVSETATAGPLTGVSVSTGYDALLRRTSLAVAKGGTNLLAQGFGFDAAGRLASAAQGTASAVYTYWPQSASNLVQSITFKNNGQPVLTTAKNYDALDRLGSIVSTVSGATTPVAAYAYGYNAANERVRMDTAADGTHWLYGYDGLGQVTGASRRWSDEGLVAGQQYGYAYDGIGNRTSTSTNGRPSAYTSNALNEYTQRAVPGAVDVVGTAAPDAVVTLNGQPVLRQQGGYFAGTVAADNHQVPVDVPVDITAVRQGAANSGAMDMRTGSVFVPRTPEQFGYDLDGNLTGDGHWTYIWDGENQLVGMEALGGLPAAERKKLAFRYDDTGRRVQKRVWTWNAGAGTYEATTDTIFACDGWNLAAEVDGANSGATLRSYLWGSDLSGSPQDAGGTGGLLAVVDHAANPDPQSYFACFDGSGNVGALIKAVDGSTGALYDYAAFGETIKMVGTISAENPIQFSSKCKDWETGLVYYGARYYDSSLGRWLSREPSGEFDGPNPFAFLRNHASDFADVLGLYGVSGHFYTTFIAARAAGYDVDAAYSLAYYSQYPDQIWDLSAYNGIEDSAGMIATGNEFYKDIKEELHSLYGDDAFPRRKCLSDLIRDPALAPWVKGLLIHAYGDSYAHTTGSGDSFSPTYGPTLGHANPLDGDSGHAPDIITNRPDLYAHYLNALTNVLAKSSGNQVNSDILQHVFDTIPTIPTHSITDEDAAFRDLAIQNGYNRRYKPEAGQGGLNPLPPDKMPALSEEQVQKVIDLIKRKCCKK